MSRGLRGRREEQRQPRGERRGDGAGVVVRVPGCCGPVATSASLLRGRPPEGSAGSPLGHTRSPPAGKPALSGTPPPASIGFDS